jgi:LacI family transcriptional regulator
VAVDSAFSFGRSILRGVLRYANLQRRWQLHEDIFRLVEGQAHWPRCDGAIVAGVDERTLDYIRGRTTHVISCSGRRYAAEVPSVALDDATAGRMAAQHFLDCRLQRFAFYGASFNTVAALRCDAFTAMLESRGFTCVQCPVTWPSGSDWLTHAHRPQLMKWLRDLPKPIGIMAADDAAGHDLNAACLDAGIPVPDHVAILGVNNDDLLCEGAWPPLSSIETDYSRMGYLAAKMLERLMDGETLAPEERQVRLPPLGVVQRQSTSILALDDPNLVDAVRFIREHACDPCTVTDILDEVPVGRRWLYRQFARQLGRTPHDEISRVRIETAQRLLLQPDLAMPDIAFRCGYTTLASFHVAFRQITNTTPAAYRRASLHGDKRSTP